MILGLLAGVLMIIAALAIAYFIYSFQKIEDLDTKTNQIYNIYKNKALFNKVPYNYHHMLVSNPDLCSEYCGDDSQCTAWEMEEGDLGKLDIPTCNLYNNPSYNPETDLDDKTNSIVGIWSGAFE